MRDGITQVAEAVNVAMDRQTKRLGEMMAELRDEMRSMREAFESQHGNNTIPGWYTHGIWLFHDDYPTYIMALYTVVDILNAFY
ncbi:MAG TPA: hypothetical protein VGH54_14660 [Mycobacterium sp.]|uniref:hypothetical protein n=1 Tax=Mycobacterium sp. TaxID=1785 RepID=UPI002F428FEF